MKYLNRIIKQEKCTEGMSPATVYKCEIDGTCCYLKTINKAFAGTTYSVKREAEVMQWLADKLHVPQLLESGETDYSEYLIMSEIYGQHIDSFAEEPLQYISYLAKAIKLLQGIDISNCSFTSNLDFRLKELNYLLENNLADVDVSHWEETTEFKEPCELYKWLCENKPQEELVFSHGDIGANFFVKDGEIYFYDLARCGIADKWMDIAFCVRDIRDYFPDSKYEKMFFDMLGVEPNYEKINYYILLDEMF